MAATVWVAIFSFAGGIQLTTIVAMPPIRGCSDNTILAGQSRDFRAQANITVFNNNFTDADGTSSAVFELVPPLNNQGGYVLAESGKYGPAEPVWRYRNLEEPSFWSFFISGAHRLPNGNTFIDSGARGRYFEVTPEGEVVWEYWTPYAGTIENEQDALAARTIAPYLYLTFRATKLPPDHPGLAGRNLAPLDPQPDPEPYPELD